MYYGYYGSSRRLRGGSYVNNDSTLRTAYSAGNADPTSEYPIIGFRLAYVPEPATLGMLTLGGLALLRRKR